MAQHEVNLRLFGGLGNQLFQYYAGLYFAKQLDRSLGLDFRWIERGYGHLGSDLRDFKLNRGIREITCDSDGPLNFGFERIRTITAREIPFLGRKLGLYVPKDQGFVTLVPQSHKMDVRGYFQTPEYFSTVSDVEPPLKLELQSRQFQVCQEFLQEKKFLAVHVRGGDYLSKNNFYQILGDEYYQVAIDQALVASQSERVVVFSDDIEYAKQLIGSRFTLEYLPKNGLRASEEMELMSLASSIVIANSTFSYWAAIRSKSSKVLAPENWFTQRQLPPHFYPISWTVIPLR